MAYTKPKLTNKICSCINSTWAILGDIDFSAFILSIHSGGNYSLPLTESNVYSICIDILENISESEFIFKLDQKRALHQRTQILDDVLYCISSKFAISKDFILNRSLHDYTQKKYYLGVFFCILTDVYSITSKDIAVITDYSLMSVSRYCSLIRTMQENNYKDKEILDKFTEIKKELLNKKNSNHVAA